MSISTYTNLPAAVCAAGRRVIVDSRIAAQVIQLCNTYKVQAYSGKRFEPGSDHNCGAAVDFTGSDNAQRALYSYAQSSGKYAYVEPWASSHTIGALGTTGPHVHISFFRCGGMPNSNTQAPSGNLSFSQIEQIWVQAGGSRSLAPTMAAISMAETGGTGNPRAHCLNCVPGVTEDSRGLWQINIDPTANPQFSNWNLYNPLTNAKAAVLLANGGKGLDNWTTYTSGKFLDYLPGKSSVGGFNPGLPIKDIPGVVGGIPGSVASGLGGLWGDVTGVPGDILGAVTNPIEKGLKYLALSLVYVLLIMAGTTAGLVGLAMIGIDIGMGSRNSRAVKVVTRIPGAGTVHRSAQRVTNRKPAYNPSKENAKAYTVGVQRGERAKAKAKGYQEGKEGNVVSIRAKQGSTKTVVVPSERQKANARAQRQAKKYGKKAPF